MQCIIMENTLIKLTLHDETKRRAHDSHTVSLITKQNQVCNKRNTILPIEIPTMCLYKFEPNLIDILSKMIMESITQFLT